MSVISGQPQPGVSREAGAGQPAAAGRHPGHPVQAQLLQMRDHPVQDQGLHQWSLRGTRGRERINLDPMTSEEIIFQTQTISALFKLLKFSSPVLSQFQSVHLQESIPGQHLRPLPALGVQPGLRQGD